MNVNEVIGNRAIQLLGGELGSKTAGPPQRRRQHGPVVQRHLPHRDAHRRRAALEDTCSPPPQALATAIEAKARQWADVVKIGRTHLQDAVPLTVGQEWSGYGAPAQRGARPGQSVR